MIRNVDLRGNARNIPTGGEPHLTFFSKDVELFLLKIAHELGHLMFLSVIIEVNISYAYFVPYTLNSVTGTGYAKYERSFPTCIIVLSTWPTAMQMSKKGLNMSYWWPVPITPLRVYYDHMATITKLQ